MAGFSQVLTAVGVRHQVEWRGFGANMRAGPDILAEFGSKKVALDVTTAVVDQPTGIRKAASTDLYHARVREGVKDYAYGEELRRQGYQLLTPCFESTGAMGAEFLEFWTALERVVRDKGGDFSFVWPRTWATPSFAKYAKFRLAVLHVRHQLQVLLDGVESVAERRGGLGRK